MSFANAWQPAPPFRTAFNMGSLLDIPTGTYYTGPNGESVLIGGLHQLTGITGRGNTFKSAFTFFMILRLLQRYVKSMGMVYDTEMSASIARLKALGRTIGLDGDVLDNLERFIMVDKVQYMGNVWYDMLKKFGEERIKTKGIMKTVPVALPNVVKCPIPFVFGIDSFSQFTTDSVTKVQEKGEIGESERNVEALRDAHAKDQLIKELPHKAAQLGLWGIMTAHVGDQLNLDPYAPVQKKLAFLKGGVKLKNVPEKFTFLVNNCWYGLSSEVLVNQGTKGPEFPKPGEDFMKGDPELMAVTYVNLRGKGGITGAPITLVFSQREGLLPSLSEFYYIKGVNRFGLGGNDRNYYLELLPDVALSRTTVRGKIDENPKLRRALEITSEMCQLRFFQSEIWADYKIEPAELYKCLSEKGYDWDRLLDTRGYWVFEEDEKDEAQPFLSTLDLLKMAKGEYHPKWYGKVGKDLKTA